MAGLYLVGAWLLVQVAGTVLPMFGAPEWLPRSIVILLAHRIYSRTDIFLGIRTDAAGSSCLSLIHAIRLIRGSFETLKIIAFLAPKDATSTK